MKAVITTVPFGAFDPRPIEMLTAAGIEFEINPLGRKLRNDEVAGVIGDADIVIAGTEQISDQVFDRCPNLKAVCRVGIGLDSVDLAAAKRRGIAVSYTPDAPSDAVAELTIGLMIDALRGASTADRHIRSGVWQRNAGRRLALATVGIVGVGRIGGRVIKHLLGGFPGVRVLANDIAPTTAFDGQVTWVEKDLLYRSSDIVSLHLPLTRETRNLISKAEMRGFKPGSIIVNTARGGIVNEGDLADALRTGVIGAAAVDVFESEPYEGPLTEADNAILTCHLGSMTEDCRARMEVEAVQEAVRFAAGEMLASPAPWDD